MEPWMKGEPRRLTVGDLTVTASRKSVRELFDANELPLDYYRRTMIARDTGHHNSPWALIEPKAIGRYTVSSFDRGMPYDSWEVYVVMKIDGPNQSETEIEGEA